MAGRRDRQTQLAREADAARSVSTHATPEEVAPPARSEGGDEPRGSRPARVARPASPGSSDSPAAPAAAPASSRRRRGASVAASSSTSSPSSSAPAEGHDTAAADRPATQGKGRPTPKRSEAEARNRRPVVVTDRKEAKRRARADREETYRRQQAGIAAGDERFFLPRDRGPARRFARNYVDARWNFGELMLPLAVVALVLLLFQSFAPTVFVWGIMAIYLLLVFGFIEAMFVGLTVRSKARQKFGADGVPAWTGWYAGMRALQIRRMRTPKPTVNRGQKLD